MTLVQQLAAFARKTDVPDEVRASVRGRVLDVLGISIAALPLDTSTAILEHVRALGGAPQARTAGLATMVPAAQAALAGGVLAHSLDYDDTHLPSILHPSAPVVPAALAAAQLASANGRRTADAIAVGLEICVRLGMAGYDQTARNSTFFDRGQHATSICGAIGAAAAAAVVLGLDEITVAHAMGIAASMGSGLLEANRAGGTVKRLHCGWAAHAGVTAAELARAGFTAPPTVLEGRFGFYQAWLSGAFDADAITRELGTAWEVPGIFFKPYPANHFTHTAIDAAIALRERGVSPDDVESIMLGVAGPTVRTIGEPIESKRAPETGYQAQFSGPYAVAAALIGGGGLGLGLDDFTDERARDERRRALAARVSVSADAECDTIYPYQFPCVLTARLRGGETVVEKVLTNRGGSARPLTDDELERKFRDNAARVLPEDAVARIEDAVKRMDQLDSLDELLVPTAKE